MTFTNDVYNQLRKLISLKSCAIREGEDQSRTTIHCCRKRNSFKPPYDKILPEKEADSVCRKGSRLAHLYGLPKTHKPPLSMRPILSATGTYNFLLAK